MKKNIITFLLLSILVMSWSSCFIIGQGETVMEKNFNKCITGISIENIDNPIEEEKLKHFGIINIFLAWEDEYPENFLKIIKEKNKIPIITWEPYLHNNDDKNILPDIISGKYDNLIKKFAGKIKSYNYYIFLRWAHEMNGGWYPWATSPEIYKKAYLHVYNIFKSIECPKLKFIFSINNFDDKKIYPHKFENYYPGDDAVDVIGIDGYNWGNTDKTIGWKNPNQIFNEPYNRIKKLSEIKPVFITETASTSKGGDKIKWIKYFFSLLKTKYKGVKAVIWFDIDKETDWSISQNNLVWSTYLNEINNDHYTADIKKILWIFENNIKE